MARIVHNEDGHELVACTPDEWDCLWTFIKAWDNLQDHLRTGLPKTHADRVEWSKKEFVLDSRLTKARLAIGDANARRVVGLA